MTANGTTDKYTQPSLPCVRLKATVLSQTTQVCLLLPLVPLLSLLNPQTNLWSSCHTVLNECREAGLTFPFWPAIIQITPVQTPSPPVWLFLNVFYPGLPKGNRLPCFPSQQAGTVK